MSVWPPVSVAYCLTPSARAVTLATMPPEKIAVGGRVVDLSQRFAQSSVVAGSPALAAETTICTLTLDQSVAVATGVLLFGYAGFTVGTSGTACRLRIRQTSTAGTVIADTDATTGGIAAAAKVDMNCQGFDASPSGSQVYVLTLTVTAGSAISTVGFTNLTAIIL